MKAEKLAGGTMVISLPSGLYQLGGTEQVTDQFIFISMEKVKVKGTQSCPTLCDPMDYTVNGILQARILEWVAVPFSRGSSQPRSQTWVSCIAGRFFTS